MLKKNFFFIFKNKNENAAFRHYLQSKPFLANSLIEYIFSFQQNQFA